MTDKVQSFFRAYNVHLPNRKIRNHRPDFVRGAMENIDFLLKNTQDEELITALQNARESWVSAAGFVPAASTTPKVAAKVAAFSLHTFIRDHGLVKPDSFKVESAQEAREYREAIQNAMSEATDLPGNARTNLQRWVRGWKSIEVRYSADTDVNSRKAPPLSYLQKKREKAAKSREIREMMTRKK